LAIKAVEFFSGIGAFSEAIKLGGHNIEVVQAFDQSAVANAAYALNHGLVPCAKSIEALKVHDIAGGDLWWLSPPCQPYSRRGKQKDLDDARAQSFIHIMGLVEKLQPSSLIVENVEGFLYSRAFAWLQEIARINEYHLSVLSLCSSQFGTPMLRPRVFVVMSRFLHNLNSQVLPAPVERRLSEFVTSNYGEQFLLDSQTFEKHRDSINLVRANENQAYCICFTSGYFRCRLASGSLIELPDGRVRFFTPCEILKLLGFGGRFKLPEGLKLEKQYKLVGNSVDVRVVDYLLGRLYSPEVESLSLRGLL
jgi:DNA (cytosine-5)-methyltransferase 1/tRNA (cytosine38-C5)-methyltransferase